MSTVQPKKRGKTASGKFSRTIQVFDSNFDQKDVKVEGEIALATDLSSAYSLLGSDEEAIVTAINQFAKTRALTAKIKEATANGEVSARSVMKFLRPYRLMARYKDLPEKEQTSTLLAEIKNQPFAMEALRAQAAADAENEDEDSDE